MALVMMITQADGLTVTTRRYLKAMTVIPATPRRGTIDRLIRDRTDAGSWALTDGMYLLAADAEQAAKLNVKAPGSFTIVESGDGVPWTADQGYTGDGTDYLALVYAPGIDINNFVLNSAHYAVWTSSDVAQDTYDFGVASDAAAAQTTRMNTRSVGNLFIARINDTTNGSVASTRSIGYWGANRSGASARQFYKNGASILTDSVAATVLPGAFALLRSQTVRSTRQVRVACFGGSLTAGMWADDYAAFSDYLSGL
jgi:hypothetical protein